jgi:hypothetical protein
VNHIISRGDRREDGVDRQDFLKTLAETCQKAGFKARGYESEQHTPLTLNQATDG